MADARLEKTHSKLKTVSAKSPLQFRRKGRLRRRQWSSRPKPMGFSRTEETGDGPWNIEDGFGETIL
ncbi:hypothetical protein LINPERPRIM_LOCUS30118 [Linum perenne]